MKKTFILIIVAVVVITTIIFSKYVEYSNQKTEIKKINKEFLAYQNSSVQINTVVSLMNKAISQNQKNNIEQDANKLFKENNTNSIKIYLETTSSDGKTKVQIPMEDLILGEKAGAEKVEYAFSDLLFNITDVEYDHRAAAGLGVYEVLDLLSEVALLKERFNAAGFVAGLL